MPTLSDVFGYLDVIWRWALLAPVLATIFLPKSPINKILLTVLSLAIWQFIGTGLIGSFALLGIWGALQKRHQAAEPNEIPSHTFSIALLIVSAGAIFFLHKSEPKSQSMAGMSDSSYNAAEGLRGAVEKIPVPSSSKVIFRQDWNRFSMSASSPTITATGYRWVLKSDKPIDEVELFYQSMNPPPMRDSSFGNPTYSFKMGLSSVEIEVVKEDGQFVIKESRPKF